MLLIIIMNLSTMGMTSLESTIAARSLTAWHLTSLSKRLEKGWGRGLSFRPGGEGGTQLVPLTKAKASTKASGLRGSINSGRDCLPAHIHIQSRSAAVDANGQASSGVVASRWQTVMLPRRADVTKTAAWSWGFTMLVRDRWKEDVAL